MVNKKLWLLILVIFLVLGMTVIGCNNDSTSGGDNSTGGGGSSTGGGGGSTSLIGTWVWLVPPNQKYTLVFTIDRVTFTIFNSETSAVIQPAQGGTYTISGNTVAFIYDDPTYSVEPFTISGNKLTSTTNPNVIYIKQ